LITENLPTMIFKKRGIDEFVYPLQVYQINDSFILAVYQGKLSPLDMLLRYRQKVKDKKIPNNYVWSNIRTPKHIHWAVDILIKMHQEEELTKTFVNFLLQKWNETFAQNSDEQRIEMIKITNLLPTTEEESKNFYRLNGYGEYSVKFLLLMAKLLMQQEKNNMYDAYMFKNLLEALRKGENIFKVVSIATQRGGG
jgi:hypothetical protein